MGQTPDRKRKMMKNRASVQLRMIVVGDHHSDSSYSFNKTILALSPDSFKLATWERDTPSL